MKPTSKRTPLIVLSGLAVSLLLAALPALAVSLDEETPEPIPTPASSDESSLLEQTDDATGAERTRRRVEVLKSNVADETEVRERQTATENRLEERAAAQTERTVNTEARLEERATTAAERQTTMENRRQEILANQAERRAALTERAQARIMNLAANISNRMEAALRRLENVSERMGSRLDLMAERGMNVDAARAQLLIAEAEIQSAYQTLADIDTQVTGAVTSEDPRRTWEGVRTTYASARDDIRAAHQALREVLALTKAAMQTETDSAAPDLAE